MRAGLPLCIFVIVCFLTPLNFAMADQPEEIPAALKAEAVKGDANAQIEYAQALNKRAFDLVYYSQGQHRDEAEKLREEAQEWAQKAAAQGLAKAWFWLGQTSFGDTGIQHYIKAAKLGDPDAFSALFDKYLFRAGPDADLKLVKEFADLARNKNITDIYDAEVKFQTIDRCYDAGKPVIPAGDQPSPSEKVSFLREKSPCIFYQAGVGIPVNFASYRKCLLSQKYVDNNELAEIYANGWGVKRDAKLALALVCHGSSVPAELQGMVNTLANTSRQVSLTKPFLFCDHVTSGNNTGYCAHQREELEEARRAAATSGITANWAKPHVTLFREVQKTADTFFDIHSVNEQDMSGTARSAIAIAEHAKLRDEFLTAIRKFEKGKLPTDNNFKAADRKLNSVYKQLMNKAKSHTVGTINSYGIKKTQRKWLPYRDALVKFGVARYPATNKDVWLTWITKKRTHQLNTLLDWFNM